MSTNPDEARVIRILLDLTPERQAEWRPALAAALQAESLSAALLDAPDDGRIDYAVFAPNGPWQDFSTMPGLKAVLNTWAGVEKVVGNPTLTVPLARMVDPGLTEGMVEYVTGHVLRHHLGMDRHIRGLAGRWEKHVPPLAEDRRVTVLGLGALGLACAETLRGLGFDVAGWSRSPKSAEGITCLH